MKKVVLITGANGMLAKKLASIIESQFTVRFLTRNVVSSDQFRWDVDAQYIDPDALQDVHTIIHLAGSSIADGRWTTKRKETIRSSRVDGAKLILKELDRQNLKIDSFISASAIGYYGSNTTNNIYHEDSPKGDDFLSDVCGEWEAAANAFHTSMRAERLAILRIGVILSNDGGALSKMMQPIKYGFGAALGTGNQYVPWIHISDLANIFKFVLNNKSLEGVYNAVAPQFTTNSELTKALGQVMAKPLILPNVPSFVLKMILGEMSTLVLDGSRISASKILGAGLKFKYSKLSKALEEILQ